MAIDRIQRKLDRVRPVHVQIAYDVEIAETVQRKELPFVVGVLANLSGTSAEQLPQLRDRKFIDVDLERFNEVLEAMHPRLAFVVDNTLGDAQSQMAIELHFRHIDDFEPLRVINQVASLRTLLETRQQISAARATQEDAVVLARIAGIDDQLSRQLSAIMHAPEFQRLEASWRGLYYFVSRTENSLMLKLRVLDVSKQDLALDFERASDFDQSAAFKKIYEDAYGTFGAWPFGALIGDFEFSHETQDVALLTWISHIAAAAHAPFIAAVSPRLFGFESFTQFSGIRDLAKTFSGVEYAKWNSFRENEDARFVGLTLPRMLLRLPYGPDTQPVEEFSFHEDVDSQRPQTYLWGNAAYAFASSLTNAFSRYNWCAAIRGVEGGGLVEGLPTGTFITDERDKARKCSTEVAIADRREKELADLGFLPLIASLGTDYACFFSPQSCQKPVRYDHDVPNANAHLATQFQYVLTTARFAHYLKVIMRDKLGSFHSRGDCERFLNQWISQYVLLDENATSEVKATHPLREVRIDVGDAPGKPGVYQAAMFIRPHFQLDELSVSLRLLVELPTPARS